MLHQMILVVMLLGAYAAEYHMESESEMPTQAKNIVNSFRTKLEKSKVVNSDIQAMSFLMSIIKQMVLDLDREQQQVEKENALFRGSRE